MKGLGVDTVLVPFKNPNLNLVERQNQSLYAALRVDENHEILGKKKKKNYLWQHWWLTAPRARGQVIRFLVVFGISETYGGYN